MSEQLRQILHIGQIGRAHGLRGEFKILPLTDDPGRFSKLKKCLLLAPDEKTSAEIVVEWARGAEDQLIVKLKGIDSRDQAEAMRGRILAVDRANAVKLPADHWFICDLIGCEVFDEIEGHLGRVSDIQQNAAQDLYIVHLAGQADVLFPALKTILKKVDIEGRRIDVRLPEGLFEVYRERKA